MSDDWSLKYYVRPMMETMIIKENGDSIFSKEGFHKHTIEILRKKLIEDIEKSIDEHYEVWKKHDNDIQEKHEMKDIIIFEIINKLFGVEK